MRHIFILMMSVSLMFALGKSTVKGNCSYVYGSPSYFSKVINSNFFTYDEYKMYKDSNGEYQFKEFSTQAINFLEKVKKSAQEDCASSGAKIINIVQLNHQVDKDKFYFSATVNYIK